jgi:hypothetical protein
VRRGLGAWRAASGHDAHSSAEVADLPRGIAAALEARRLDVDWTPLLALAERHASCAVPAGVPGRRDGAVPGPAR